MIWSAVRPVSSAMWSNFAVNVPTPAEAERPMLERLGDAFLDRRNVVARHRAAGDHLFELEASATRQRLHVDHDIAKLAVAARLLLVTAANIENGFLYRFAIADLRLVPLDRHRVAASEPLGRNAQMHLALPPHHDLVRFGIVQDSQGRVLVNQLVERLPQLHVVLALFGGN